jgi:hypothetical protein
VAKPKSHKSRRAQRLKRRQEQDRELVELIQDLNRVVMPEPDLGNRGMPPDIGPDEFVRKHCYWPAKDPSDLPENVKTKTTTDGVILVAGNLNECQEDYLERRSAFRLDKRGRLQAGSDITVKARQIYFTSLIMALTIWALIRFPGIRATCFIHQDTDDTRLELKARARIIFNNLPWGWAEVISPPGADTVRLANGSSYVFSLAGQTERAAEGQGRSKPAHIVHFADAGFYRYGQKLHAAVKGAMPHKGGIRVAEGTPGYRDGWHTLEAKATRDGFGSFARYHFWPWHFFSGKRIHRGSERYSQMMESAFVSLLPPDEIQKEVTLGLDDEQIAWRRDAFFTGTLEERLQRKRENPEDLESCFPPVDQPYFDEGAIARARARTASRPKWSKRVTPLLTIRSYIEGNPPGAVVFGQDQAAKKPKANRANDRSATVAIDYETLDVLATIHGHADPDEHAEAVQILLNRWNLERGRYVCVADVTQDFGLTREQRKMGFRQWKPRKASRIGLTINTRNRQEILGHLAMFIEGAEPPFEPQSACPDPQLVDEFSTMVDTGRKVEHSEGCYDDLVMALGYALYVRKRWRPARESQPVPDKPPEKQRLIRSISRHSSPFS